MITNTSNDFCKIYSKLNNGNRIKIKLKGLSLELQNMVAKILSVFFFVNSFLTNFSLVLHTMIVKLINEVNRIYKKNRQCKTYENKLS